jgi:hypothetical protein
VFLLPNQSLAQKEQQDVIYLKNGSILHGKITEIKANESITIINNCGDTWVINQIDIDRIEKEEFTSKKTRIKDTLIVPTSYKYSGFYSGIQLTLLKGTMDDTPLPHMSLLFTSGYQFKCGLNVGAGIGIDLLEEPYMPIVLDLKYVIRDSRVSPYFYINGGYVLALQDPDYDEYYYYDYSSSYYGYYDREITAHGGYTINPGMGFKFNLTNKNAILLNFGYRYMAVSQTYNDWNGQEIDRTLKFNRLVLGLSFQF